MCTLIALAWGDTLCEIPKGPMLQVAAMMLQRGLATVVKHRTDDERSAHYEVLLEAEQVRQNDELFLCSPAGRAALQVTRRSQMEIDHSYSMLMHLSWTLR